ncbi:hypothetical protein QRX60_34995 [Amycolatopsis mongoliensis]|uniref:Uncharacterized protein n=1 Tax=Amycolatopsis mongoliensis TaxID=715475 RepID=A0A9Y2JL26_9PSEU|nr:hypothetical protein [Amycolatopsis sp. 4-36]WIX99231.1 hypothetical protein QRX60_34995 [Amycolatopsis sp. 4-36]
MSRFLRSAEFRNSQFRGETAAVPEVSAAAADEIAEIGPDQAISIVLCGLLHVQTAVSVHDPPGGRIPLCTKLDELGTVYA